MLSRFKEILKGNQGIKYKSSSLNLYHCCAHKTGSQWLRQILSDPRIYQYSGLRHHNPELDSFGNVDTRKIIDKTFDNPFPKRTILSPLYIGFENFLEIPKLERYAAFFVMRDPRDIVTSYYFSMRYSHSLIANVAQLRSDLEKLSIIAGFIHVMEDLDDYGTFSALHSWADAGQHDPNVMVIKFEELTAEDNLIAFEQLFKHCDIRLPREEVSRLLKEYSFSRLSGRLKGHEDREAHYRKGIAGDWINYFNKEVEARFREITGDLIMRLGYEQM